MPQDFQYDVFLSYSSHDKPRVSELAKQLRQAGLRVWFDEWVIKPGDDIYLTIERGLQAARVQVLCLSPAALKSDWVSLERSTTLFRNPTNVDRRFFPLLLTHCELPDALRRFKYLDFNQNSDSVIEEISAACRTEIAKGPRNENSESVREPIEPPRKSLTTMWFYLAIFLFAITFAYWWLAQRVQPIELQVATGFRHSIDPVVKDPDTLDRILLSGDVFAGLNAQQKDTDQNRATFDWASRQRALLEKHLAAGAIKVATFEGTTLSVQHSNHGFDFRNPRGYYYWRIDVPMDLKDPETWIPNDCYVYGVEITDSNGNQHYLFPHNFWQQGPGNRVTVVTYLGNLKNEFTAEKWSYAWNLRVYFGSRPPKIVR